jgi:hypothetical protein
MGAYAVEGTGPGEANKPTYNQLCNFAFLPSILFTGIVTTSGATPTSPPLSTGTAIFPKPLSGSPDNYMVFLTGKNTGWAQISSLTENENGDFSGFLVNSLYDGDVNFMVIGTHD